MHTMRTNGAVEVQLHPFLTSALDEGGQLYDPPKSYSCKETNHIPWLPSPYPSHYADYACTLLILKRVKIKVTLEQTTKA